MRHLCEWRVVDWCIGRLCALRQRALAYIVQKPLALIMLIIIIIMYVLCTVCAVVCMGESKREESIKFTHQTLNAKSVHGNMKSF